ncbi:MAG: F420-dependent glucose-6-phosphate dehydrogenase [Anaerolineae bacterium]|nr:F420-dependent glucose-6-phosphate dehydrogenase [Anaerolineae bacterium]
MTVDFGLSLPAGPPKGQLDKFLTDMDAVLPHLKGRFKSLWMTDHFFWGDAPTHEAWTVIAFVAARWPQFDIGPMVLGQSYRNPALLAKMAATLQTLSHGRFIMAIGAGWKEDEYHAYGYPYPSPGVRVEQLEDSLEIITRLWREPGQVTYLGKHYSITNAYCEPKPDPVPPIIVGGGGSKTMRLAAKFADWWNLPDANFADYNAKVDILRQQCDSVGRDPANLRLTWFGRMALGRTDAEARQRGGRWTNQNALAGTPAQVVEQLQQFIDLGVDYFMIEVLGVDQPGVRAMLLEEVLPQVQQI